MFPTIDDALDLSPASTDLPLQATKVSAAPVEINSTPLEGLAVAVYIPAVAGATDTTLSIYVRASTTSTPSTTSPIVGYRDGITAAGTYIVPFNTNKRSVYVEYTVAGTSPDFSTVQAYIVQNVGQDWTREVNFY